ncbi:isocitrate lyase/PEP mutase family protein [Sporolactobacillus vineae]|uniref:isocitrate lyase/PEP mutase family protein n=1 Tax=Sporolactobacillus vineae TaxID=444463 RepID=UPI0002FEFBD0|nr:isocitrate lyase/PEP mutase family protein [Sporolactobacillus vineae]
MSVLSDDLCSDLRFQIQTGKPLVIPGIFDGISAKLTQKTGFPAALVSSVGAEGTLLGSDNYGLLSMSERARHLRYIRQTVDLPLIIDAESGYGNALNTFYTAKEFERSGASALILNDQSAPSVSEFFQNLKVIETQEMIGKIHAAKDALENPESFIIARTDSLAAKGIDEAFSRARAYRDAGADLIIIGGLTDDTFIAQAAALSSEFPVGIDRIEGRNHTFSSAQDLFKKGYGVVFYPASTLFAASQAEEAALRQLSGSSKSDKSDYTFSSRIAGHQPLKKEVQP